MFFLVRLKLILCRQAIKKKKKKKKKNNCMILRSCVVIILLEVRSRDRRFLHIPVSHHNILN